MQISKLFIPNIWFTYTMPTLTLRKNKGKKTNQNIRFINLFLLRVFPLYFLLEKMFQILTRLQLYTLEMLLMINNPTVRVYVLENVLGTVFEIVTFSNFNIKKGHSFGFMLIMTVKV